MGNVRTYLRDSSGACIAGASIISRSAVEVSSPMGDGQDRESWLYWVAPLPGLYWPWVSTSISGPRRCRGTVPLV